MWMTATGSTADWLGAEDPPDPGPSWCPEATEDPTGEPFPRALGDELSALRVSSRASLEARPKAHAGDLPFSPARAAARERDTASRPRDVVFGEWRACIRGEYPGPPDALVDPDVDSPLSSEVSVI
jgi:hypothetical protein